MIDTHAHLSSTAFDPDREEVLDRAFAAGLSHIVEVGIEPRSSVWAIALAERLADRFVATCGIHPHEAGRHALADVDALARHLANRRVVAVGETGLDFYRDYAPRDRQMAIFRRHVELALEHELPLVLHSRGAEETVLDVLEELGAERVGGVLHCYGGPPELVPRILALGFHLGFGGSVTRNEGRYRRILQLVPLDRILLETDCPYLAPAPGVSRRNEPAFLSEVPPVMAALMDVPETVLVTAADANAARLFALAPVETHAPRDARQS
jgi:TatD DNase family protein